MQKMNTDNERRKGSIDLATRIHTIAENEDFFTTVALHEWLILISVCDTEIRWCGIISVQIRIDCCSALKRGVDRSQITLSLEV
jgi:hypothetical protein